MRARAVEALFLIAWFAAACSSGMRPPARAPNGPWSDATSVLQVTDTGATFMMICEADTLRQSLRLDANGNFAWNGIAHVGINVFDSPRHSATFSGQASAAELVITRNVTDVTGIAAVTHTLLPQPTSITPCPYGAHISTWRACST
jgi:hypothetical protein